MMKRLISTLLMLLAAPMYAQESLPEPYNSIQDLPFDPHGWFFNANQLQKCMKDKNIQTVIEVGAWLGSSTRFLATQIESNGKVYAIDTWAGTSNESVHMQDPRLPYLYQQFLSNVKHAKLAHKIIPIRMESQEAARALQVKADLIYIDASHDEENVYRDIIAWHSHLVPNGLMTGDDWLWESVRRGVGRAAAQLGKTVNSEGNFWWFTNPNSENLTNASPNVNLGSEKVNHS